MIQDRLICGNSSQTGCTNANQIPTSCQGKKSWGLVDRNSDGTTDAWCHGTMGCDDICTTQIVADTGSAIGVGQRVDINQRASSTLGAAQDSELLFHCGCQGATNLPCDSNFDGRFNGRCTGSGTCT